jgi:hypothetical protein
MKGDTVPDRHHVSRLCKPRTVREDGEIGASAFILKESEESLSVNWLEYLKCSSRKSEIAEIRRVYSLKLNIGAKARLAVLNVGEVRKKVLTRSPDGRDLEVLHEPSTNDLSHSGMHNLKPDNELIAELILETVRESYSARGEG